MSKKNTTANYDMATELILHIDKLASQRAYYEAVILQTALIEHLLRLAIKELTPDNASYDHFYNAETRLVDLINYWHLLCNAPSIYKNLDKYRKDRNNLVHYILTFHDLTDLRLFSKKTFVLGESIINSLRDTEPFKTLIINFKSKPKITYFRRGSKGKLKFNFV